MQVQSRRFSPIATSLLVVAVDVGKTSVALSVTDAARRRLLGPVEFAMTRPALAAVTEQVRRVLPVGDAVVPGGC